MTITSSDLPGILSALHDTSSDLDKLDQTILNDNIDREYSGAEAAYLKLDEVSFIATMKFLLIVASPLERFLVSNNIHDTVDAWISIRKINAANEKKDELLTAIYGGKGEGKGYGQPDDPDHLLKFPPGMGSFASLGKDDQQLVNDLRAKASVDHSLLKVMVTCARHGIDYRYVTSGLPSSWTWHA